MICEEHGIFDVLPCPWPNCESGCPETEFEVINSFKLSTKENEIFSRREWKSPEGGVYYSWDGSNLPNWFGIEKTIWSEARRLGIINESNPEVIYHYTDINGFKGMVESGSIWLSDYSYLNDATELSHGAKLISDRASKMLKLPEYKLSHELIQSWIKGINDVNHKVYIASFSSDPDNLSQWRSYGNIAIGFSTQTPIGYPSETHFKPVEYDVKKQEKLISLFLSHMCQAYDIDNSSGRLQKNNDLYQKIFRLITLVTFFKNPGFKDEKEYRIAYIEDSELFEEMGVMIPSTNFRVSQDKLIPYVKSSDLPTPMDEKFDINICSVILGPDTNSILERGVKEILNYNGYKKIKIRKSGVPYRT